MSKKKVFAAALVAIVCILLNIGGKVLSDLCGLPVFLDALGTIICAAIYGPVCGAIVGAATNIACCFSQLTYLVYALVNLATGIIVGICAKRKMLDNLFGALSTAFIVTITSVCISTPINMIFTNGNTGNKWGDGVIALVYNNSENRLLSCIAGQFYVDFVDRVLCVMLIYGILKLYRRFDNQKIKKIVRDFISVSMTAVLCFWLLPTEAFASSDSVFATKYSTYLKTTYNAENGLPGGAANDIAQTKDGVLWIGTYGGLYRYSGNEFQWMNHFETVKNVNCFFTDEEGRLWIGTNDNGISICVNDEISNTLNSDDGLPSDSVRCIAQSNYGYYYVGTSDALAIVTLANGLTVTDVISPITYAKSISVGNQYTAIVSDDNTLYILDGKEIVLCSDQSKFTCCTFSDNGVLYAGTTTGEIEKYRVSNGSMELIQLISCGSLTYINSIVSAPLNYYLVCAENGAGFLNDKGVYESISLGSFSSCIENVIIDYQGNLWFISSRQGLLKMSNSPFNEIYDRVGLESVVVNSSVEWRGVLYFGTDNGLDAVNYGFTNIVTNSLTEQFKNIRIRSLMTDSKGNLWICTARNGLMCVDKDMTITTYTAADGLISDKIRNSLETSNGDILIGEELGISCIRDGNVIYNITQKDGLDIPKILSMVETADGNILAGTDGSGIAVINNGKILDVLTTEDGLTSGVVLRLIPNSSGEGWFVVTSNSLCYMDNDFKIRQLENFPYFNNYDVIEREDGLLFVLSSAGIYVMDKDTLLNGGSEYTLLDYSKGLRVSLTSNAWNCCDESGNVFLSCDSGVVSLNLYKYEISMRSYRMNLSSVQIDDDICTSLDGETFSIPRGVQRVVFNPDIINYSLNNPYVSFYLEGFDSAPKVKLLSEVSEQVYTNLPTGTYKFRMAVLDEKWNVTAETYYTIIKEKEIYDEWWFQIYVWAVLITVIFYLSWLFFRTQFQRTLSVQKRELDFAKRQIEMGNEAIMTIARTVDAKDMNTSQHSFRVSEYSLMIAKRLGLNAQQCEELRKTALLHDIGKIGIPDSVLNKPAKLTDEEYAIMKSHVVKGAEILENFSSVNNIVEGAKYHHERYDGNGYMEGLKGEEIPLNARIIGIADAFDAMTANRVYRKRLDIDVVISELKRCRGTQFDPELTDIMLELIEDGTIQVEKLYEESKDAPERRESR